MGGGLLRWPRRLRQRRRGCSRAGRRQRRLRVPPLSVVARRVGGEGGWVGDVGVDNETIAVGNEVKKTLQSTTREKEGGGEVLRRRRR